MEKRDENWFSNWFDTPYYHLLYKDRDEAEATEFINNIIQYLKPKQNANILDLACGKGRHSLIINKLGYSVTGIDLSSNSIMLANKNARTNLRFSVHDMREPFQEGGFDYVFNLFTSFGYFNDQNDNQKVLDAVAQNLRPNGHFVLDFLNSVKVLDELVPYEEKQIDGILFKISKTYKNNVILKTITFTDKNCDYSFTERVTAFSKNELESLFRNSRLEITTYFGDYALNLFESLTSNRLIILAKKTD